jgi:hypothetical protein
MGQARHPRHAGCSYLVCCGPIFASAGVVALQTTSCGLQSTALRPRVKRPGATASYSFAACPYFFCGRYRTPCAKGTHEGRITISLWCLLILVVCLFSRQQKNSKAIPLRLVSGRGDNTSR